MKKFFVGPRALSDRLLSNERIQRGLVQTKMAFDEALLFGGSAAAGVLLYGSLAAPSVGEAIARSSQGGVMEAAACATAAFYLCTAANFTVGLLFKPKAATADVIADVEHIRNTHSKPKM